LTIATQLSLDAVFTIIIRFANPQKNKYRGVKSGEQWDQVEWWRFSVYGREQYFASCTVASFLLHAAPHKFSRRRGSVLLDKEFPDRWKRKGRTILWPPHFPDLTPLDSFGVGVGVVRSIVYRENVQHMNQLRDRIVRAAECFTNEKLIQHLARS
jgi:hypothetical protein